MAKIYTKTGDKGTTGLIGGQRVTKNDPRIDLIGEVDELNAAVGLASSFCSNPTLQTLLGEIQSQLFELGATIANPQQNNGVPEHLGAEWIEAKIDQTESELEPLRQFILPGGGHSGAALHLARAICRRAERKLTTLMQAQNVHSSVQVYLNRLSDLLFCLARFANAQDRVYEVKWTPEPKS